MVRNAKITLPGTLPGPLQLLEVCNFVGLKGTYRFKLPQRYRNRCSTKQVTFKSAREELIL